MFAAYADVFLGFRYLLFLARTDGQVPDQVRDSGSAQAEKRAAEMDMKTLEAVSRFVDFFFSVRTFASAMSGCACLV